MRLTTHSDYALRVLIYLALTPERLATIREISERYDISRNHLMKIVRELGQHGYVETVRGKNGGLRLGRAPELITIGAVVRDMEDNWNLVECFKVDGDHCQIVPHCLLKDVLGEALEQFLSVLDRYTLAQMAEPKGDLISIMGLESSAA